VLGVVRVSQRVLLLPLLAGFLAALVACADSAENAPEITVAAAADLQFAFQDISTAFEQTCNCKMVLTFGSSGNFAAQIEEGLPADVFASADTAYVDDLDRKGLILADTKQVYGVGRIVLAVSAGSALQGSDLSDLLNPAIRKIAIANPDHAPYGVAAKQALEKVGLWDAVKPKLVLGENASQASQFVETGDAQAGIIPLSLAVQGRDRFRYVLIDQSLYTPLRQAAAVVARSRQPDLARAFIEFLNGPQGRPIMKKYGFVLPGEEAAP